MHEIYHCGRIGAVEFLAHTELQASAVDAKGPVERFQSHPNHETAPPFQHARLASQQHVRTDKNKTEKMLLDPPMQAQGEAVGLSIRATPRMH